MNQEDSARSPRAIWRNSSTKLRCGSACYFAVKEFQPFDQYGHFSAEQFCQADVEAKRIAESVFENDACPVCISHLAPASANAASDSVRCSRTASTVKREIGSPRVALVRGETNRTTDSILSGISFKTPTYRPRPAATIEESSVSPKSRAGPVSIPSSRPCMASFILFQTVLHSCLFHQACFPSVPEKENSHNAFRSHCLLVRRDDKKRLGTHQGDDLK